ncbi:HVA22-like protein k [Diospyros lotus]|uniref:HVA22-like protein k n=1 Tax=Diospyros lotus TaxID=55363 RepID=UPI002257F254|nr:HVA22-like protein k [Diospyros lotus]
MALFGPNLPTDVGLRLLLSPIGSNVVVRTACCSVGIILPVYSTFKAIETENQNEQKKWLMYWAAYGSFSIAEVFTDKFISWFPLYYHMKFAFLVWLQLPTVDGSKQLYNNCLRPFLLRHQARLDQIVGTVYCEMAKFVSAHRAEIQFARTVFTKISVSANHFVCDIFHPARRGENGASEGPRHEQTHASRAIEGPTTEELSSGSEIDE